MQIKYLTEQFTYEIAEVLKIEGDVVYCVKDGLEYTESLKKLRRNCVYKNSYGGTGEGPFVKLVGFK